MKPRRIMHIMPVSRPILALFLLPLLPAPAPAAESPVSATAHGTVSLVSETDAARAGRPLRIGLWFRLAPGWHIYGRDPGDVGLPPELTLPPGLDPKPLPWPVPGMIREGGLVSRIYTGPVLLPYSVTPGADGLSVSAEARWLVCEKICVPEQARFALHLPAGDPRPSPQAGLFADASASVVSGTANGVAATITANGVAATMPAGPTVPAGRWPRLFGFAFLGGLLLNLMPCVFPVLAMKALALARLGGAARREVRRQALAYAAGAACCFGGLGAALLGLRGLGRAADWGTQFQSPVFVAATGWGLLLLGLNLSGAYAVGGRITGLGQGLAGRGGLAGSFGTGLLAVLVAAPCTAPFMAGAIAAALAAPPAFALPLFLAMGLGLAAPTLLLAAAPGLARRLPRPGPWMEVLRQALAFPLYAAVAWLSWVLAQEAGPEGLLYGAAGLVLAGFGAWGLGLGQRLGWRRAGAGFALPAALGLGLLAARLQGVDAEPSAQSAMGAEGFSPARLEALRAGARPVLVDVGAAWCVTCLVNERLVLDTPAVRALLARRGVALLRADWTRRDPAIADYLHGFGRDGVPLYVYYPRRGEPVMLPQILARPLLEHAIDAADR